jgi:ribose transport system permease protein
MTHWSNKNEVFELVATESDEEKSGKENSDQSLVADAARPPGKPRSKDRRNKLVNNLAYRYGLVFLWLALIVLFGALRPASFLTVANFGVMFGSQASTIILALALVVTLSVGEFDLSVASTLGLTATIIAVLNGQDHWPILVAIIVGVASGVLVGAINGLMVVFLGIDGIVITLGMATLVLGVAIWFSQEQSIGGVSIGFTNSMIYPIFGVSVAFYYALAIAAIVWYILRRTPLGRHMLFIGHNREVARLVGIPVNRIRFGAFVFGGLISAIAGVSGGFLADSSQGLLLPAFAAAFLGAAVIVPGRFNAWGTVVAILFLVTGITGLELLGLAGTAWISQVFYGGALIAAVTISSLLGKNRDAGM